MSFNSIRCAKKSVRDNLYVSSWLNNFIQFKFDSYKYDIKSSNNMIADVHVRKQLFVLDSTVVDILSK